VPREGAIIFRDLVGKLDVLHVECEKCGRRGLTADAAAGDGAAERAGAELEGFVMKETSGERERAEPPGALSRPDRLKPVPAVLSLSSRRRLHGAPPRDTRVARGVREP
jgi:hypothetical protein